MRCDQANCEQKGFAAVSWLKGTKHQFYEDRFRLLPREIPLVEKQKRGEIFAVFDGIGSAPEGRHAAQEMADCLIRFYRESNVFPASWEGIEALLTEVNTSIFNWGCMDGTDKPLGGCAGTVVWLYEDQLYVFHAGDTAGLIIRDGNVTSLTREHQSEDGAIFRYYGIGNHFTLDVEHFLIEESDRILLLSDGVTKVFHPKEAAKLVENHHDISNAVTELVRQSQLKGSTDDITAMLIEVEEIWE